MSRYTVNEACARATHRLQDSAGGFLANNLNKFSENRIHKYVQPQTELVLKKNLIFFYLQKTKKNRINSTLNLPIEYLSCQAELSRKKRG